MRSVEPESVAVELQPVMIARVSREELVRLLPVDFRDLDPLAVPEPSVGAVVELKSGRLAALSYGRETGELTVEVAPGPQAASVLLEFLLEAPIESQAIEWVKPELIAATHQETVAHGRG